MKRARGLIGPSRARLRNYCSPIRPLRHAGELDARNDERADGSRPEVIAPYGGSVEEMVRRRDEQCPMGRMGDAWAYEVRLPSWGLHRLAEYLRARAPATTPALNHAAAPQAPRTGGRN